MGLIGITGGIGSGKSTVSKYLIDKGYRVLDADVIGKGLLKPNTPTIKKVEKAFGSEVMNPDGTLNRRKLAQLIFTDPAKKRALEEIMHKKIFDVIREQSQSYTEKGILFVDAPLIFEAGWDACMDKVIVVDADIETRIKRVMKRDFLSREEIVNRMMNQLNDAVRNEKADFILDNSGNKTKLYEQIDSLLNVLEEKTTS